MSDNHQRTWDSWGQNRDNSRIFKAKQPEMTPLEVDVVAGQAEFVGASDGCVGEIYETTLTECTCVDFVRRDGASPCKHMYRLAMELHLMPSQGLQFDPDAPLQRLRIGLANYELSKQSVSPVRSTPAPILFPPPPQNPRLVCPEQVPYHKKGRYLYLLCAVLGMIIIIVAINALLSSLSNRQNSDVSITVEGTPAPAYVRAPTIAPTATLVPRDPLTKGDKGENVKALQQRLIDLFYLTGEADGSYGNKTAKAVADFQRITNIEANGEADPATQTALFDVKAPENPETDVWTNTRIKSAFTAATKQVMSEMLHSVSLVDGCINIFIGDSKATESKALSAIYDTLDLTQGVPASIEFTFIGTKFSIRAFFQTSTLQEINWKQFQSRDIPTIADEYKYSSW